MTDEVQELERPKKRPKPPIEVEVVRKTGKSSLVKWMTQSNLHMAYIPSESIREGKVTFEDLEAGVPYGECWESLKVNLISPEKIAQAFRNAGIFTLQDFLGQKQAAMLCVMGLLGLTPSEILAQMRATNKETNP